MSLTTFKVCESWDDWQVLIQSQSHKFVYYECYVTPEDGPDGVTCTCMGFEIHGHCKHQQMAWENYCGWSEKTFPGILQEDDHECPVCGRPTRRVTEWQEK